MLLLLLLFFITVDLLVLFCFFSHLGPPGNNGTILQQFSEENCELYQEPQLKCRQHTEQNVQPSYEGELKIDKKQFHTWFSCFVNTYLVTETKMYMCVLFNTHVKAAVFQPACSCIEQKTQTSSAAHSSLSASPMQDEPFHNFTFFLAFLQRELTYPAVLHKPPTPLAMLSMEIHAHFSFLKVLRM